MDYSSVVRNRMRERWLSGNHVGAWRPVLRAYVRSVKIERRYRTVPHSQIFARVPGLGQGASTIWQGKWVPKSVWKPLPNVANVNGTQTFDENGVQSATVVVDNIAMTEQEGAAGLWHLIERGYYSPFRGYKPPRRPSVGTENEWSDVLHDKSTQIMIVGGYGDCVVPLFSGLINDVNGSSRPDKITIVARDPGQVVTDQQVFVNAKIRHVRDPITFADRLRTYDHKVVGAGWEASDHAPEHPARFAGDNLSTTAWRSDEHDHPTAVPYIEVIVPAGTYDSIVVHPLYRDMEMYVAIKARDSNAPGGNGARRHGGGGSFADGEWIGEGGGNVPTTGHGFVSYFERVRAKSTTIPLPGAGYDLGDDSRIRLYFTNLHRELLPDRRFAWIAGVVEFNAQQATSLTPDEKKRDWILVDDLSDVVKTVFQWCGINDWEVETTGVRLKKPVTFNRGNMLVEILKNAAESVNYVLYFKPPRSFDESEDGLNSMEVEDSLCTGVFRSTSGMRQATDTFEPVEQTTEDDTLTGIEYSLSDEPLAYNIRVRGDLAPKKSDDGRTLGGDRDERFMYVYRPPWSRESEYRNANIKKYVVHHDIKLQSIDECKIAALFIAWAEALEAGKGQFECPMNPCVHMDHQIGVLDEGTGISSRVWVAMRNWEWVGGEKGKFTMNLGGGLLDLPDTVAVRKELVAALDDDANPGLSQWERDHFGAIYRNN